MAEVTFSQTCVCGQMFSDLGAFMHHEKGCCKGKKRLASALEKVKQVYQRKKARLSVARAISKSDNTGIELASTFDADQVHGFQLAESTLQQVRGRNFRSSVNSEKGSVYQSLATLTISGYASQAAITTSPYQFALIFDIAEELSSSLCSLLRKIFKSQINKFGLFRAYNTNTLPSYDPEDPYSVDNACVVNSNPETQDKVHMNPYFPYPNEGVLRLGDWYWNQGAQKSRESFKQLIDIVRDSSFSPAVVAHTSWDAINDQLGHNQFDGNQPEWLEEDHGWKCLSVMISVPFHSRVKDPGPKNYTVNGFYHHSLTSFIHEAVTNPAHVQHFHFVPYELWWWPAHRDHDVKVHGELFASTVFLEAHQELQDSPQEPGCDLPHVVAALMFWSDSTQLAQFGSAKLWPLYVFFGNESKYQRCQPSNHLCAHVAYFQVLPDEFKDFLMEHFRGKYPGDVLTTHYNREFFHEQWKILLDDDFITAYKHGIVIICCDGIKRQFYL
ncbi:hypothetical protein PISMIDRAFT_11343 [Pisolithus microcarpus 441]|uniref:Uncharacterized protein n=1 Tax=Pisolithus microcarpus 441 TaxID=765257 RepID=A0A0C9YD83_9AGAM|nr:hypothetical protein PISMIDRAFT_11343 [Pisolithus microcarpus 441]